MKTSATKARLKDIKQGVTLYTAHPVYGIDKRIVVGRPYFEKSTRSLFVECVQYFDNLQIETTSSLCDMGITSTYNDRRTFFKLKHAKAWMAKWSTQVGFIERQANHEEWCEMQEDYDYL